MADDLPRVAVRHDLTVGEQDAPIRHARHDLHVVRREHDGGAAGREPAQDPLEVCLRGVVEAAGRLVEQDKPRSVRQDDGEGEDESLALGEVSWVCVAVDAMQQLVEDGSRRASLEASLRVGRRALRGDRGLREQELGTLGHEPDEAGPLLRGQVDRASSLDLDDTLGRRADPREEAEQRRLARAVAPHERRDGATVKLQAGVAQRHERAEGDRRPLRAGRDGTVAPGITCVGRRHAEACTQRASEPASVPDPKGGGRQPGEIGELDHRRDDGVRAISAAGSPSTTAASPPGTMTRRSAKGSTRSSRCSATTTVRPTSCTRRASVASTSSAAIGSRADVGSSRTSTRGAAVRTEPIATRCRCPPDRVRSNLARTGCRPRRSSVSSTLRRIAAGGTPRFSIV